MNMDKDDYFKDFDLAAYRFIVVNNIDKPTPLVWNFRQTMASGPIQVGYKKLRDPEVIGSELSYYLKENPNVPLGIDANRPNNIESWFDNE